jgi:transmembrane 9 superfamily protein 2/4
MSIMNSMAMVVFLAGMIATIMLRTLHRDIAAYNEREIDEEAQREETGWKLIHGEVFRPPVWGGFFSVLVGSGVQILAMTCPTLALAAFGVLSPAWRGGLMMSFALLFNFSGIAGGYFSTRVYKSFKLTEWKRNTFITATFFPGTVFTIFFIINLFIMDNAASGAVPFDTLVALLVLWFGISVPLVCRWRDCSCDGVRSFVFSALCARNSLRSICLHLHTIIQTSARTTRSRSRSRSRR